MNLEFLGLILTNKNRLVKIKNKQTRLVKIVLVGKKIIKVQIRICRIVGSGEQVKRFKTKKFKKS